MNLEAALIRHRTNKSWSSFLDHQMAAPGGESTHPAMNLGAESHDVNDCLVCTIVVFRRIRDNGPVSATVT